MWGGGGTTWGFAFRPSLHPALASASLVCALRALPPMPGAIENRGCLVVVNECGEVVLVCFVCARGFLHTKTLAFRAQYIVCMWRKCTVEWVLVVVRFVFVCYVSVCFFGGSLTHSPLPKHRRTELSMGWVVMGWIVVGSRCPPAGRDFFQPGSRGHIRPHCSPGHPGLLLWRHCPGHRSRSCLLALFAVERKVGGG